MHRAAALITLALGLFPITCHAGDREAIKLYSEAVKHWKDPDPSEAVRLAEEALKEAGTPRIRVNVLVLLGKLHQVKTGEIDTALDYYDRVIRETIGKRDNNLKKLKADAFLNKGNILYAEKDDLEGALDNYQAGHRTYPTALSADTLSQLLFRLGRASQDKTTRAEKLSLARKMAEEALKRDKLDGRRTPAGTAKYRLQLVLVLEGQGEGEAAKTEEAKIDPKTYTEGALYQRAILAGVRKADAEKVGELLKELMKTRPTVKTRNQLRSFIRTEPDFQQYLENEGWKKLVTDEAEADK